MNYEHRSASDQHDQKRITTLYSPVLKSSSLLMYLQDNLLEFNHVSMRTQSSHGLDFSQVVHLINTEKKQRIKRLIQNVIRQPLQRIKKHKAININYESAL